ncbi:MAG: GNAT family N-acetyltransferase [Pyrinomonadaceae bacterium]
MNILETERLILREVVESDDEFIFDLVNQPSFIKYIGNRGIDTLEKSRQAIKDRYRSSYAEFGYGLYAVELKKTGEPIGFCGFVRRESLPEADIGFAFLPQFEKKGFAFESASAVMNYGQEKLKLSKVLAITTQNNESSIKLLNKLGFKFERLIKMPDDETELNLFSFSWN